MAYSLRHSYICFRLMKGAFVNGVRIIMTLKEPLNKGMVLG
ncbi:hypothetical protein MNBD_ALPHA02-2188 [hydrothermal vent metagenome]|uniref:Uncharacterized protein n=1 Tax=hydrothermal vent metagenome TaxID=652676 RepID=A0A3B0RIG6_9ZZZZ